ILPVTRACACAGEFTTSTPLIAGTPVASATSCSACDTLAPTISWWFVSPAISTPSPITQSQRPLRASAWAAHGTSCEPGTRTTGRFFSFTPAAASLAKTRASNASTSAALKRAAAIPIRKREASMARGGGDDKLMKGLLAGSRRLSAIRNLSTERTGRSEFFEQEDREGREDFFEQEGRKG